MHARQSPRRRRRPARRPAAAGRLLVDLPRHPRGLARSSARACLDGMNAYDSAILSGGPVHFTLGLAKKSGGGGHSTTPPRTASIYPGELCPSLSLFCRRSTPAEYARLLRLLRPRAAGDVGGPAGGDVLLGATASTAAGSCSRTTRGTSPTPRKVTPETVAAGRAAPGPTTTTSSSSRSSTTGTGSTAGRWRRGSAGPSARSTYRLARGRLRALLTTPWGDQRLHGRRRLHLREGGGDPRAHPRLLAAGPCSASRRTRRPSGAGRRWRTSTSTLIERRLRRGQEDRRRRPDGVGRRRGGGDSSPSSWS